jgi:hypothetical protein
VDFRVETTLFLEHWLFVGPPVLQPCHVKAKLIQITRIVYLFSLTLCFQEWGMVMVSGILFVISLESKRLSIHILYCYNHNKFLPLLAYYGCCSYYFIIFMSVNYS